MPVHAQMLPILRLMNKEWVLTQESFDQLLTWLNADRERAALKYEAIRCRLIEIFNARRCSEAEDLADETINRVTLKVMQIRETYTGDPARYFYAVAKKIYLEYTTRNVVVKVSVEDAPELRTASLPGDEEEETEREDACLTSCLERLSDSNRNLILKYYQPGAHPRARKNELARNVGATANALRIRAHRIRASLKQCVELCLRQQRASV